MNFPEGAEDEAVNDNQPEFGDDWKWDAHVPETETDDITLEDLSHAPAQVEEQVEDNEPDEDDFCIVCGKSKKDSPSDLYCNECREKFLRTDYGVSHVILAFVMVIVAAVGYFVFASTWSIASKVSKAESYISEKRYDDAVSVCSEIGDDIKTVNNGVNAVFTSVNKNFNAVDWFNEGRRTTLLILESYADVLTTENSEHEDFVRGVELSFVDKDSKFDYSLLQKPKYDKIRKTYDFCNELIESSAKYIQGLQEFISNGPDSSVIVEYDKAMKYIDSLDAKTSAEKSMADYCRFIVAYYAKKDSNTIFGFFDSLCENAGEFEYIFWSTYMAAAYDNTSYDKVAPIAEKAIARNVNDTNAYYYLINSYISTNDMDSADKFCEQMKQNNPEGLDYYAMKANILRRQGKFEESVDVCKNGIKEGDNIEIYRQQAISYMLLDNRDDALEAIKQAYTMTMQSTSADTGGYNFVDILNTCALITCICGDDETYKSLVDIFESEGVSFKQTVQDCIKGEITFEEIFMKGTGDVR